MPLKVSISSVEWCFFTRYGRKVDFFSIECRKMSLPYLHDYIDSITLCKFFESSTAKIIKSVKFCKLDIDHHSPWYWLIKRSHVQWVIMSSSPFHPPLKFFNSYYCVYVTRVPKVHKVRNVMLLKKTIYTCRRILRLR